MKNRKVLLIVVMLLSLVPIFLAIEAQFDFVDQRAVLYLVARQLGLIGTVILFWQFLLGIRGLVSKVIPDLIWVNDLHKKLGKYGFILILFHPVLMTVFYLGSGINLIGPKFETDFDKFKSVGVLAFTLLVVVWIASAILKSKIRFRPWKRLHFLVYIALPLVIIHGLNIGMTLGTNQMLKNYWFFLSVILTIAIVYRLLLNIGIFKSKYEIVEMRKLTPDTTQIVMKPVSKRLDPLPGQFIYIQNDHFGETHPFTVSHFEDESGLLSITPKSVGMFTTDMQKLEVGKIVYLDGPFGVFTQEAYTTEKPIVIIAGGIGITPFMRLIHKLSPEWQRDVTLFWGNKTEQDISFGQDLETARAGGLKIVNVLSNQENYNGEKGYITAELLQKYLGDLTRYEYFVCGPPVMMEKLLPMVEAAGVPKNQIHAEKFGL